MRDLELLTPSEHWQRPAAKDSVLLLFHRDTNISSGTTSDYIPAEWDLHNQSFVDISTSAPNGTSTSPAEKRNDVFFEKKLNCVRQDTGCSGLFTGTPGAVHRVNAGRFVFRDGLDAICLNKFLLGDTKLGDTFRAKLACSAPAGGRGAGEKHASSPVSSQAGSAGSGRNEEDNSVGGPSQPPQAPDESPHPTGEEGDGAGGESSNSLSVDITVAAIYPSVRFCEADLPSWGQSISKKILQTPAGGSLGGKLTRKEYDGLRATVRFVAGTEELVLFSQDRRAESIKTRPADTSSCSDSCGLVTTDDMGDGESGSILQRSERWMEADIVVGAGALSDAAEYLLSSLQLGEAAELELESLSPAAGAALLPVLPGAGSTGSNESGGRKKRLILWLVDVDLASHAKFRAGALSEEVLGFFRTRKNFAAKELMLQQVGLWGGEGTDSCSR